MKMAEGNIGNTPNTANTPTIGELEKFLEDHVTNEQLVKASQAAAIAVQDMFTAGYEMERPSVTEEWIEQYTNHVWAYAAIFAIATTIGQLRFKLQRRDKATGELEEVPSHPILDLLHDPNNSMTGFDLLENTVVYLETCGDSYWEIVYERRTTTAAGKVISRTNNPAELWPVRPDRMTPEPRKDGKGINRYVYQVKSYARKHYFSPEQIVPIHYFHPLRDWTGMGSIQPAVDDLRQDKQMAKWNLDFFEHGVTPEGLISTDQRMTPKEVQDLGAQIREFLAGKGRKVLILSKNLKWQTISVSPKDVEFLDGRKENRQAILAAMGVPPVKVGLLENAKYSNYDLQVMSFHRDTIIPKVRKIQGCLQKFLVPKFADLAPTDAAEYILAFDTTPLLKEDEDRLVDRFVKMVQNGIMTPNEARKRLGMDPYPDGVPGGDMMYMPKSMVPVSEIALEKAETEESLEMREDMVNKRIDDMEDGIKEALDGFREQIKDEVVKELREEL